MTKSTAQQFDMIDKIRTQQQYEGIMKMIEKFIQKATELGGFHMLSQEDDDQLHQLSTLANDYERKHLLPGSFTLSLNMLIQKRLEELKLNQASFAELINTSESKVSKIITGKQEPDVQFLKAIHNKLGIDGNVLLDAL
jgi:antitoxin component HigA of HigAB toxin-antitoxin module